MGAYKVLTVLFDATFPLKLSSNQETNRKILRGRRFLALPNNSNQRL